MAWKVIGALKPEIHGERLRLGMRLESWVRSEYEKFTFECAFSLRSNGSIETSKPGGCSSPAKRSPSRRRQGSKAKRGVKQTGVGSKAPRKKKTTV